MAKSRAMMRKNGKGCTKIFVRWPGAVVGARNRVSRSLVWSYHCFRGDRWGNLREKLKL